MKRPDFAITQMAANGITEVKWVLEVGLSEGYEQLVSDMKLWLEGQPQVSMAVLVKMEETPTYNRPVDPGMDDDDFKKLGIPEQPSDVRVRDFTRQGEYGPVTYQGFTWAGRISRVFMEVWKLDPTTGLARRDYDRVDLLSPGHPSQIQFRLGDFLRLDPTDSRTATLDVG